MYWMLLLVMTSVGGLCGFFAIALRKQLFSRSRIELDIALRALRGMKWGDFAQQAVALLEKRGLSVHEKHERQPGEGGVDLLMRRGSARYLVQCKHGGSYQVSPASIDQLAALIHMREAAGAFLINAGAPDSSLHPVAAKKNIEIIEGIELWHQLESLLPFDLVEQIHRDTAQQMRDRQRTAVLGATGFAALGLALGFALLQPGPTAPSASPTAPAPAGLPASRELLPTAGGANALQRPTTVSGLDNDPANIPDAAPDLPEQASVDPVEASTKPTAPAALPDPTLTADQIERRREMVESTIRQLSGVRNAAWSSRSTLLLLLNRPTASAAGSGDVDAGIAAEAEAESARQLDERVAAVCTEITRYEEMRFTRLQVQFAEPRNDHEARVRWRQCD